jgi:outer membrane protein OmpA-like peptidoglycan-associated protein
MKVARSMTVVLLPWLMFTNPSFAQTTLPGPRPSFNHSSAPNRNILAIKYADHQKTRIDMVGTALAPRVKGRADIEFTHGRSSVKLEMPSLGNPQSLGALYTIFVLWAIGPEGQANNIAELPAREGFTIEATTPFQTFGLIITAEPYSAVKLPSSLIVAENGLHKDTEGTIEAARIEYRGESGTFYVAESGWRVSKTDSKTPLLVLGARRAVEIARRAGAQAYAGPELRDAETKLTSLEQSWPSVAKHGDARTFERRLGGVARDVMRLGERARELAIERADQASLQAERQTAQQTVARAQTEAVRAREAAASSRAEVARAQQDADEARTRVAQAQTDADRARANEALTRAEAEQARLRAEEATARAQQEVLASRQQVADAQTQADQAKANEDLARAEAEQSRLKADEAERARDAVQRRLYQSLSEVLETRQEARGLIVNLSDVLFDVNRTTLKPGARERLHKLAGILLAYPGQYRIEIEGHTDSAGADDYNLRLSQDRAESVRECLAQAGIRPDRLVAVRGLGKAAPVASNDTPAGRQLNRRVEIIVDDAASQGRQNEH